MTSKSSQVVSDVNRFKRQNFQETQDGQNFILKIIGARIAEHSSKKRLLELEEVQRLLDQLNKIVPKAAEIAEMKKKFKLTLLEIDDSFVDFTQSLLKEECFKPLAHYERIPETDKTIEHSTSKTAQSFSIGSMNLTNLNFNEISTNCTAKKEIRNNRFTNSNSLLKFFRMKKPIVKKKKVITNTGLAEKFNKLPMGTCERFVEFENAGDKIVGKKAIDSEGATAVTTSSMINESLAIGMNKLTTVDFSKAVDNKSCDQSMGITITPVTGENSEIQIHSFCMESDVVHQKSGIPDGSIKITPFQNFENSEKSTTELIRPEESRATIRKQQKTISDNRVHQQETSVSHTKYLKLDDEFVSRILKRIPSVTKHDSPLKQKLEKHVKFPKEYNNYEMLESVVMKLDKNVRTKIKPNKKHSTLEGKYEDFYEAVTSLGPEKYEPGQDRRYGSNNI